MDNERRRILRMMAEGKISVDECEELLQALNNRRQDKTEKEIQAVSGGERPVWPYVLLIVLAIVALPFFLRTFFGILRLPMGRFDFVLPSFSLIPGLFMLSWQPIKILLTTFWIWMIVDCISRLSCDFRLLFTSQHKYEKWIWLAIVVLTGWLGALAYFIVIRQPSRKIAPPASQLLIGKTDQPEQPFRPSQRARSLKPLLIITIILIVVPLVLGLLLILFFAHTAHVVHGGNVIAIGPFAILPLAILAVIATVFWIWMLIDCLARDYREFGTLISSDKSADKLLWILLILFLPIIGAIAYHISVRRRPVSEGQ